MASGAESEKSISLDRLVFVAISAVVVLGSSGVISRQIGLYFLPTQEYLHDFNIYIVLFTTITTLLLFVAIGLVKAVSLDRLFKKNVAANHRPLLAIAFPVFFSMFAYLLSAVSLPFLDAILFGRRTTANYVVAGVPAGYARGCANRVNLQSMPFLFSEVCGVSEGIRDRLKPGMRIELTGWGTRSGLFYDGIRIIE